MMSVAWGSLSTKVAPGATTQQRPRCSIRLPCITGMQFRETVALHSTPSFISIRVCHLRVTRSWEFGVGVPSVSRLWCVLCIAERSFVWPSCAPHESPGSRKFFLASGACDFDKTRPWLGLVDLSRIPSVAFFREVHPGILARKWLAKMTKTRQNENENFQTMTNRDDS